VIETFLRPPRGVGEIVADSVRVLGLLGVVVAAVGWGGVELAVTALALVGLVLPRFLGARPALDIGFGVCVLVAAWSSVLSLYTTAPAWDIPVHFFTNGYAAAVAWVLLVRLGVLEPAAGAAAAVPTVALGVTAGVLWEFGEWAGHTFLDRSIFVAYDDTIGDLAVGAAGSVVAGLAIGFLAGESRWRGVRRLG
jgi:hypothetical protein